MTAVSATTGSRPVEAPRSPHQALSRFGGRDDGDIRETSKDKQVVVATHDHVGVCGKSEREDMVVGRITADRVFQGRWVDDFRELPHFSCRPLQGRARLRKDCGKLRATEYTRQFRNQR